MPWKTGSIWAQNVFYRKNFGGIDTVTLNLANLDITVDAVNLAKRNPELIQLEMERILALISQPLVLEKLAQENVDFSMSEFIKDIIDNLQTVKNGDKYFRQVEGQQEEQQPEPIEIGENIVKTTQADDLGNKVEETQKEKVFA